MFIDMKGYKVVYENSVYTCLSVDPIYNIDDNNNEVVDRLHVLFLNHNAQIDVFVDEAKAFAFIKDTKIA